MSELVSASRRDFLKASTAAAVGAGAIGPLSLAGCGEGVTPPASINALPAAVSAADKDAPAKAAPGDAVQFAAIPGNVVLLVHGGCGVIPRKNMTEEMEKDHRKGLEEALKAGYAALQEPRATSRDGVVAAIKVLEDSPLFNAGHGAVFTREGKNELDASIMDGRTKEAGAVASVTTIRNPITAARIVMEKSGHVLMVGDGAERFAESMGISPVDPSYFRTEYRWKQHLKGLQEEQEQEKRKPEGADKPSEAGQASIPARRRTADRVGTVGAVALDNAGNISAGTSTGGLNNKRHGRVGDSPIIGAGNYADNEACAISSTGDGEFFLRAVAAHEIASLVKYKGLSIAEASRQVLRQIKEAGGDGAVIVLTRKGEAAMAYNTEGMYRGYITSDGKPHVFIYAQESASSSR